MYFNLPYKISQALQHSLSKEVESSQSLYDESKLFMQTPAPVVTPMGYSHHKPPQQSRSSWHHTPSSWHLSSGLIEGAALVKNGDTKRRRRRIFTRVIFKESVECFFWLKMAPRVANGTML